MTVSRETHQSGSELGRNVPVDRPQASHVVDDFLLGKECLSSVQNVLSVQIAQAIKFWLPAAKTHLDFGVPSRGPLCRLVRCADAEQPFAEQNEVKDEGGIICSTCDWQRERTRFSSKERQSCYRRKSSYVSTCAS